MRDVARLAGVSPMTVSRVQAGSSRVAPETRDRIRRAIEQLGYVDDKVAAALSSRRTGFIATLVPTLTNSTFADTAHGLTEALRRSGYQLLIGYTLYRMSEEEALIRTMLERRPEAIVLAGMHHTEAARTMREQDIGDVVVADGPELSGLVTDRDIVVRAVAERHGGHLRYEDAAPEGSCFVVKIPMPAGASPLH